MSQQFIKLYKDLPCNKDLTAMESIILSHIIDLSQKEGYCYANNKALADKANCNEETVKIAIRKLKKLRVIYTSSPNRCRRIHLYEQYQGLLVSEKEAKKNKNMDRGKQISSKLKAQKTRIKSLEDTVAEQSRDIRELKAEINLIKAHITLHGIQIGTLQHKQ